MTQVAQIVARALRTLRILDAGEAAEAMDMQTAISALNAMMRRWEANGLRLNWVDVSGPEDVMPTPPAAEQAICANLAISLRPEYGAPLEQDVLEAATNGLNELRRDAYVANPITVRLNLPRCGHYDILTDEVS